MSEIDWSRYPTPTLMRAARGTYAQSIRAELRAAGIDDLPRNGLFILTAIDFYGGPRPDLPSELGVTKQAVSLVIDTLVNRGYLERHADAGDRRRVILELTDQGREVVDTAARGVEAVDHKLAARLSHEQIHAMRSGLIALTRIKTISLATGAGQRRPPRELLRFSPIFPVRDLAAAVAHYRALGFETFGYEDGADYGFANRNGVGLHLAAVHGHDSAGHGADGHDADGHDAAGHGADGHGADGHDADGHDADGHDADGHEHAVPGTGSAYLYVRDADALYAEWTRPGIAGHTYPVETTPYKLREGSHVDPDGNLIRFGSPIEEEEA